MTDIFLCLRSVQGERRGKFTWLCRLLKTLARKLLYSSRFALRSFGESVNRQIGESIFPQE